MEMMQRFYDTHGSLDILVYFRLFAAQYISMYKAYTSQRLRLSCSGSASAGLCFRLNPQVLLCEVEGFWRYVNTNELKHSTTIAWFRVVLMVEE